MPKSIKQQLASKEGMFAGLDGLVFTHSHADHYDEELVAEFLRLNPDTPVYLAGTIWPCAVTADKTSKETFFKIGKLNLFSFDTEHDGQIFRDVHHTSILVDTGSEKIFIAGDAKFYTGDYDLIGVHGPIDYGFFNVYQLNSQDVHQFIRQLQMKKVYLYHLGYPEDDEYQYWEFAKRILNRLPMDFPDSEIIEPMSSIATL